MSRRPKKRCAVCGQDIVPDPLVDPGNPPHRHQACTTAHPTRAHHHMVTLAKSSPSRSTPRPPQNENATVMLRYWLWAIATAQDGTDGVDEHPERADTVSNRTPVRTKRTTYRSLAVPPPTVASSDRSGNHCYRHGSRYSGKLYFSGSRVARAQQCTEPRNAPALIVRQEAALASPSLIEHLFAP